VYIALRLSCLSIKDHSCIYLAFFYPKVHLHTALEKTLPKFILRTVDKKEMIEYPNQDKDRLGFIENLFKYFQPKSAQKGKQS